MVVHIILMEPLKVGTFKTRKSILVAREVSLYSSGDTCILVYCVYFTHTLIIVL